MNKPILGPISRLICFISNILVAYFLRFYILPKYGQATFFENTSLDFFLLDPTLSELGQSEVFKFLIDFSIFYFAFSLACHIIFSVGLTQFLIMTSTEGGFFGKRIKAVFRFIIGLVTTPLFIFDLPIVFGKKSLKEKVSKSKIYVRSRLLKNVLLILIFPIVVFGTAIAPLFMGPEFLKNGIETIIVGDTATSPNDDNFVINIDSPYFEMRGQATIDRNLIILPYFPDKSGEILGFSVFDFNKKRSVHVEKFGNLNVFDITNEFRYANPLFPILYPQLSLLNTNDASSILLLNNDLTQKYISILQDFLPLKPELAFNLIFKRGPLLLPYYRARTRFTQNLNIDSPTTIRIKKNNDRNILIAESISNNGNNKIAITPIGPTNAPVYNLNFKVQSAALTKTVIDNIIFGPLWRPAGDYQNTGTNHPTFHTLEVLSQKELKLPLPPNMAGLFENAIKLAKESGDRRLLNEVNRSLDNLIALEEARANQDGNQVVQLLKALKEK
ncbi:MAG: hypothetical protein ACO20H_07845 [Bacteriovoracaceae bacterium]